AHAGGRYPRPGPATAGRGVSRLGTGRAGAAAPQFLGARPGGAAGLPLGRARPTGVRGAPALDPSGADRTQSAVRAGTRFLSLGGVEDTGGEAPATCAATTGYRLVSDW